MQTTIQNIARCVSNARRQSATRGAAPTAIQRLVAALQQTGSQLTGQPIIDLARAAGGDALLCSGMGWYPDSDIVASIHDGQAVLLNLVGFERIELRINPGVLGEQAKAVQPSMPGDEVLTIIWNGVRSLVRLFAGFYDYCPYDTWRHRRLVEAASWGAYRTYYPPDHEWRISSSIASFYERSMVCCALTRIEGAAFVSGLAVEKKLNQHPPHLLSALFERSQAALFPEEWDEALRICAMEPDPTADALIADALFILFRVRARRVQGNLRVRGRIRRPVSWEWPERVEMLAELLAPYLERYTESSPTGSHPFPHTNPDGNLPVPPQPFPGDSPIADPGDLVNPFMDPGDQNRQRFASQSGEGRTRPGTHRGPGTRHEFQQLDEHYSCEARTLKVMDEGHDQPQMEPEMIPVGFLDNSPASVRDLACSQIDWFRTRRCEPSEANPSGLRLYRMTDPLEIRADASDPTGRDAPNLLLIVDSSGSMNFNPQADGASRGKYDVVLMACWGIFRYLKEQQLEDRVRVNAVNFSGVTRASGWHKGSDLEPVKRVLAAYQGGGTTLDASIIRSATTSSNGHFVAIAMTDGSLSNTSQALKELQQCMKAGNHLALLHIGAPNDFTKGVGELGGAVHVLENAQNLVGLCLDLAKENYERRGGRGARQTSSMDRPYVCP